MNAQEEIKMWKTAAEKWRKNYDTIAARVGELERERDGLLREQNDEVDEFNAGFDAYKSELDLDTAEQEYQNKLRLQGTPFHDVFATGYAWAKFTTERAALAKGAK